MPIFTVSLIANTTISAQTEIEAASAAAAIAQATQMHSKGQIVWTIGGLPIPSFTGAVTSVWTNPGSIAVAGPKKVPVVLDVQPVSIAFGSTVTAIATIAQGAAGLVTFYNGVVLLGTATPNPFGVATLSGITLPIGIQPVTAQFAGDLYFSPGTSNTVNVTVTGVATATTIAATPNPQTFGSNVHITANVTSGAGVPTGLVKFYSGATQIGSAALSSGTCSIDTISLPVGMNSLIAVYQGGGSYSGSTSTPFSETIMPVVTNTTVIAAPNPQDFGSNVHITANVSPVAATGLVEFYNGVTNIGSASLFTGTCSIDTTSLPGGVNSLTAAYQGNGSYSGSTSTPFSETITPAATTTGLLLNGSIGPVTVNDGNPVNLVSTTRFAVGAGPSPGDTVTFWAQSVDIDDPVPLFVLGTSSLTGIGGGSYRASTSGTAASPPLDNANGLGWQFYAVYNGDTNYAASTSNTVDATFHAS
jgi:hypothetical protein